MEIKNVEIKPVDDDDRPRHLKPTLKVQFDIYDIKTHQIIVDVDGELFINETIISKIYINNASVKEPAIKKSPNKVWSALFHGYVELDKESLDFVEKSKDTDEYGDINFSASVTVSVLEITNTGLFTGYRRIRLEMPEESTKIKSSDWVNKFAPKLGIGNFLVLEIPFYKDSDNEIIKVALYLIGEAEKAYRAWDATTVFVKCRQVVEKLKQKVYSILTGNEKEKFDRLVAKGDKGVFGFLSFGIHADTNNRDDITHRIVTQQDAEAALYFTKILVKYTAELLNGNMVR